MALALRLDRKPCRVFTLLGDGELNEGLVWEAAMAASHYRLNNLVAILDYNGLQIDGPNEEVMGVKPVDEKWRSFGWTVVEVDGHDYAALAKVLKDAEQAEKPVLIMARTVKGKGVSFMENQVGWHGKAPSGSELEQAISELEA
jgi:transketolase